MDTLHSVLFYAFAAVTVGGGLVASLLGGRARALGVGAVAVGLAGLYADLNAGYAAIVTLVAFGASALLLLGLQYGALSTLTPAATADVVPAERFGTTSRNCPLTISPPGMITRNVPPGHASIVADLPCHAVQRSSELKNENTVEGEALMERSTTK